MESIHDLAPEIQKRLSEIGRNLNKRGVSKPEAKSMSALMRGLIQTGQVMVMPVVRVLGEKMEGLGRVRDGSKREKGAGNRERILLAECSDGG